MRIVGGSHRGRKFRAPKSIPARPTTDYAKEALFNILEAHLDWGSCEMLDLFSGIGSISIEAFSRGAKHIVCVDKNYASIRWISKLSAELGASNIQAKKSDAIKWLAANNQQFDFVFADPPYEFERYDQLIDLVLSKALTEDAIFVLEHRRSITYQDHPKFNEERTYGEVRFSFFKPNAL